MSKGLIALTEELRQIEDVIMKAEGEIIPDFEAMLDKVKTDLAVKVDAYDWMIRNLNAKANVLCDQAGERLQMAKNMRRYVDEMKDRIKQTILAMGVTEVHGNETTFKLSFGAPKLVIDEEKIPAEFKMPVTTIEVDKKKVKDALNNQTPVEGAELAPVYKLLVRPRVSE